MKLSTHNNFYIKTTALAKELEQIENSVKKQEQDLIERVSDMVKTVNSMATLFSDKSSVEQAIRGHLSQVEIIISEWQKKIENYENNIEFRKDFGDSLLVFVYGKVKAGKSTLGNYVATGRERPDAEWLKQLTGTLHSPEFFLKESNKEFEEKRNYDEGFAVGASETTSCIQGFRVPGITWVDSPGLHSVTEANGNLAKKYAESADLIIYPMNSAQPARRTDLQELEKLILANKRILLLITRCDEKDIDIDDEGNVVDSLVMKSKENRRAQENYVKGELGNICRQLNAIDVDTSAITISVKYAEVNDNSDSAMVESGMKSLFDKLEAVIDSEAINLKKHVPEKNMQSFYTLLLTEDSDISVSKIKQPLEEAIKTITSLEEKLLHQTEQVQNKIQLAFSYDLDKLVEKYADARNVKALSREINTFIGRATIDEYEPVIRDICQSAVGSMAALAQDMSIHANIVFKDKVVKKEIDVSLKHAAVGSGLGGIAGGAIGFFLGGPVGATIGATIGSTAGSAAGKYTSSKELVDIVYGDNREEIKDSLLKIGHEAIEKNLTNIQNSVRGSVFKPIRQAFDRINKETIDLEKYIRGQVKNV